MSESQPSAYAQADGQRRVSWFTAACVLVSNVIGGGIFTTTGFLARDLGDPVIILSLWLFGAILASFLILTGTFEQLVIYSGLVLTTFSALSVGAVVVLRWRDPELARPYRVPFYPVAPGLFIVASLAIVGYSLIHRPLESALGVATILAGVPLYWLWRKQPHRHRTTARGQPPEVILHEEC